MSMTVGLADMTRKDTPEWLSPEVSAYVAARAAQPDDVLNELIVRTRAETGDSAGMQVSAAQGALLTLLAGAVGARRALEIGTFTGYSSICLARGLSDGGSLLCLDVSEEFTAIAREAWAAAGVADRIELRIAPALDTLATLEASDPFDLVFIDADKPNYRNYLEAVLPLLRPGGLVLVDNTLWGGRVLEHAEAGSNTAEIQAFNDAVAADPRVESFILPVSDGMTLIRKR
jgi:caffeoyl-CoA O-methyltransferase